MTEQPNMKELKNFGLSPVAAAERGTAAGFSQVLRAGLESQRQAKVAQDQLATEKRIADELQKMHQTIKDKRGVELTIGEL